MPRPLQSMNDLPAQRPLLTLPWEAGVTGWIVVFGAVVAEIVAGSVTNRMPTAIAAPALAFPVVVAAGFAVVQWQQVRSSGAEPASWWHLAAIAPQCSPGWCGRPLPECLHRPLVHALPASSW